MQYHDIYGLRSGNEVAIIQPGKAAETYAILDGDHLQLKEHNEALAKDVLAFVIVLDDLYRSRTYN